MREIERNKSVRKCSVGKGTVSWRKFASWGSPQGEGINRIDNGKRFREHESAGLDVINIEIDWLERSW
jgi:hypothetical protein